MATKKTKPAKRVTRRRGVAEKVNSGSPSAEHGAFELLQIVVECHSEDEQGDIFDELRARGLMGRLLNLLYVEVFA